MRLDLDDNNDFGFSGIPTVDRNKELSNVKETSSDERLQAIKKLVLPLIKNLMKDPDKDIHWPNRVEKLSEFRDKFLRLVDGDDSSDK